MTENKTNVRVKSCGAAWIALALFSPAFSLELVKRGDFIVSNGLLADFAATHRKMGGQLAAAEKSAVRITSISYNYTKAWNRGISNVYIDNSWAGTVHPDSPSIAWQQSSYFGGHSPRVHAATTSVSSSSFALAGLRKELDGKAWNDWQTLLASHLTGRAAPPTRP